MSQSTQYPPGPAYKMPGKLVSEFIGDPINMLTNIAQQYGDISYFKLGREHVYLINNPDLIEKDPHTRSSQFQKGEETTDRKRTARRRISNK